MVLLTHVQAQRAAKRLCRTSPRTNTSSLTRDPSSLYVGRDVQILVTLAICKPNTTITMYLNMLLTEFVLNLPLQHGQE